MDFAANYWVAQGCPKNKLMLGMATYGRCFTLANANNFGLGAPTTGPCPAGQYTREAGFLAYYEIQTLISQGARVIYDQEQRAPYLVSGTTWVGYDNVQSLTEKIDYMKREGYGGYFTWCKDLDNFLGQAGAAYELHGTLTQQALGNIPTASGSTVTLPPIPTTPPYTGPSTTRDPSVPFCQNQSDGYYSHPTNCQQYWQCYNSGSGTLWTCTGATYWNGVSACDWPENLSPARKQECGLSGRH